MENLATISQVVWRDDASHMPAIVGLVLRLYFYGCAQDDSNNLTVLLFPHSLISTHHVGRSCFKILVSMYVIALSNKSNTIFITLVYASLVQQPSFALRHL